MAMLLQPKRMGSGQNTLADSVLSMEFSRQGGLGLRLLLVIVRVALDSLLRKNIPRKHIGDLAVLWTCPRTRG